MKPLIETNQLTIYFGKNPLIHKLNIAIYPGETCGILGKNGIGKTTLIKTLAGLNKNYQGKIFLNNFLLNSQSMLTIAKQRALVLQHYEDIFPQTVWEYCLNARFPHSKNFWGNNTYDIDIAQKILIQFDLYKMRDKKINCLSGGERQRLELASAVIQQPSIFLLDEPTNHLDIHHQHQVLKYFKTMAQKKLCAVVMVLHDINHAQQYCDKILLLDDFGNFKIGDKNSVLTAFNLSKLYTYPIFKIHQDNQIFWMS